MSQIRLPHDDSKRTLTDAQALNQLAVFMGSYEQWNGGDVCEWAADIIARTGRPPVGDQSEADLAMYRRKAEALGWGHDGD